MEVPVWRYKDSGFITRLLIDNLERRKLRDKTTGAKDDSTKDSNPSPFDEDDD
jgi:hypothetical protein